HERRYCDRELTGFELGPKRAGHRVIRLEDPPPEDRCVEDELPQRVSRILLMAAVTSKPAGGGFRLTRRSISASALRTRGSRPGPVPAPTSRPTRRARYALRLRPSRLAARSSRVSKLCSLDTRIFGSGLSISGYTMIPVERATARPMHDRIISVARMPRAGHTLSL